VKDFFKLLLEILFPDPKKKNCPHCGGSKCFGLCGMHEPAGVSEQDKGKVEESQGDYAVIMSPFMLPAPDAVKTVPFLLTMSTFFIQYFYAIRIRP